MKKIAVIADATSATFFFPRWCAYYGGLFGMENLHVLTYAGLKAQFAASGLGNVWEVNSPYNDTLRARLIADFVAILLRTYDVVLRVDIDEFLVPDPGVAANLRLFVEVNNEPYVTAHGVDIIELPQDMPLDPALPVLAQRRYARRGAALNKTALTTIPLRWAEGFHGATVPPVFSTLYNFHLKFAALKSRIAWHDLMLEKLAPGTFEHNYFGVGEGHLTGVLNHIAALPREGAETEAEFTARYLATVMQNPANRVYQGAFLAQEFLFRIEDKFLGRF